MTDLYLPASLESIEASAFSGCGNLSEVYFAGTQAQAEAIQIEVDDYPNYLAKNGGAGSALIEGVAEPDERVVGAYLELIENITTRVRKNPAYTQIVMQEVASYFDGEVSADEVSKSIQSRASTVIAESQ